MILASFYAGMAFSNTSCAAFHALAYPIGKEECRRCLVASTRAWPFPTRFVPLSMPWPTLSVRRNSDATWQSLRGHGLFHAPCAAVHALAYPIGKEECRCCWGVSTPAWPFPTHLVPLSMPSPTPQVRSNADAAWQSLRGRSFVQRALCPFLILVCPTLQVRTDTDAAGQSLRGYGIR